MEILTRLESEYLRARELGGRSELLRKMEAKIKRLKRKEELPARHPDQSEEPQTGLNGKANEKEAGVSFEDLPYWPEDAAKRYLERLQRERMTKFDSGTRVLIRLKAEPSDPYEKNFIKVMDELNAFQAEEDIDGWVSYIADHHPELDHEMNQLEAELNEIWQDGLKGQPVMGEFRATLRTWRNLQLQGIEIYKNKAEFEKICL